jgi:hypothetical protein
MPDIIPTNPYFALQARLAALIAANAYFAQAVAAKTILTEQIADLAYQVDQVVIPYGFGVVITTAEGKSVESSYGALVSDEDLNICITHNPSSMPLLNALDAQWAAIQAVHGQTVQAMPPAVLTERDYFRIIGHQQRHDGPPGTNVRELHVAAGLRLI